MSRRRRSKEPSKLGAHIMVGIIAFLMVASMGSIALYSPSYSDEMVYGETEFTIENNLYAANGLTFSNLPFRALSVPVDQEAINLLKVSAQIVMTFNPTEEENIQAIEYTRFSLAEIFPTIGGAVTQTTQEYALPVVTCADANSMQTVLFIRTAPQPAIFRDESCVILQGNASTLILAKDALLYHYFDMLLVEDLANIQQPTVEYEQYVNATQK